MIKLDNPSFPIFLLRLTSSLAFRSAGIAAKHRGDLVVAKIQRSNVIILIIVGVGVVVMASRPLFTSCHPASSLRSDPKPHADVSIRSTQLL